MISHYRVIRWKPIDVVFIYKENKHGLPQTLTGAMLKVDTFRSSNRFAISLFIPDAISCEKCMNIKSWIIPYISIAKEKKVLSCSCYNAMQMFRLTCRVVRRAASEFRESGVSVSNSAMVLLSKTESFGIA